MTTNSLKVTLIAFLMSLFCIFAYGQNRKEEVKRTNDIIQYANSVVELNDIYTASLSNYQQILATADLNLNKLSLGNPSSLAVIDCNRLRVDEILVKNIHQKMEEVPAFSQKAELDKLVFQAENVSQNVYSYCAQLDSYFGQRLYQQDANSTQYNGIKSNILNAIMQSSVSWNKAAHAAVDVANEAEIGLLKYEARADFLVPMKTDITALKNLLNMFGTGVGIDLNLINQKINDLEASIAVNQRFDGKDLSKLKNSSFQNVYEDFYKNCLNAVAIVRTLSQQISQNRNMNEIQLTFSHAKSAYAAAVNDYNMFAKQ